MDVLLWPSPDSFCSLTAGKGGRQQAAEPPDCTGPSTSHQAPPQVLLETKQCSNVAPNKGGVGQFLSLQDRRQAGEERPGR